MTSARWSGWISSSRSRSGICSAHRSANRRSTRPARLTDGARPRQLPEYDHRHPRDRPLSPRLHQGPWRAAEPPGPDRGPGAGHRPPRRGRGLLPRRPAAGRGDDRRRRRPGAFLLEDHIDGCLAPYHRYRPGAALRGRGDDRRAASSGQAIGAPERGRGPDKWECRRGEPRHSRGESTERVGVGLLPEHGELLAAALDQRVEAKDPLEPVQAGPVAGRQAQTRCCT